ncbi:MAG: aldehyde dehydrogenase family protein, partial [Chloroflexia bacterium]
MTATATPAGTYSTRTDWQLFVNGVYTPAQSGETIDVINPATNETLASVAKASIADADAAVKAARAAFDGGKWQRMGAARRASIIYKAAGIMRERFEDIARLEALNTGKAISQCKGELTQGIEDFEFFAGGATKIMGDTIPVPANFLNYTVREPIGVCLQIVPWNYPVMMASWKLAPALAAGCAVILKPASATPLTALVLAEILTEAGVPAGIVNVLPGPGAEIGSHLAEHPGVDKVAFTGETETGRQIMRSAATNLKR